MGLFKDESIYQTLKEKLGSSKQYEINAPEEVLRMINNDELLQRSLQEYATREGIAQCNWGVYGLGNPKGKGFVDKSVALCSVGKNPGSIKFSRKSKLYLCPDQTKSTAPVFLHCEFGRYEGGDPEFGNRGTYKRKSERFQLIEIPDEGFYLRTHSRGREFTCERLVGSKFFDGFTAKNILEGLESSIQAIFGKEE